MRSVIKNGKKNLKYNLFQAAKEVNYSQMYFSFIKLFSFVIEILELAIV